MPEETEAIEPTQEVDNLETSTEVPEEPYSELLSLPLLPFLSGAHGN